MKEFESGLPLDWYNEYELEEYSYSSSQDDERGEKEDMINFAYNDDAHFILRFGKPKYICWLINNVEFFSMSPENLDALEQLDVFEFYGLYLKKVEENVYSINQSFLKLKRKFSDQIKILNKSKWDAFIESQEQMSESAYCNDWNDSGSGRSNQDFYSDDDEDQIMRGLMNGDGDLFGF